MSGRIPRRVTIRLFGGADLTRDDAPITGPMIQRHRIALVAILASAVPRAVSRERLIGLLWPDRAPRLSRNLLNQAVHALRRELGDEAVASVGDDLRLEPGPHRIDVIAFDRARAAGELDAAADLYQGAFLDGFVLPGSDVFEKWQDSERTRYRADCLAVLEMLADEATEAGAGEEAVAYCGRLALLDPYSGRASARLMKAHLALGDPSAAMREAHRYTLLVRQELGIEPAPEVAALIAECRTTPPAAPAENGAEPTPVGASARVAAGDAGQDHDEGRESEAVRIEVLPEPRQRGAGARRGLIAASLTAVAAAAVLAGTLELAKVSSEPAAPSAFADGGTVPRPLDGGRILVLPLENETGIESARIDAIGAYAAARILEGVLRTGAAPRIVSFETALSLPAAERGLPQRGDRIRSAAMLTGAAWVVTGSMYSVGDSLEVMLEIRDVSRSEGAMLAPLRVALEDPSPGIDRLVTGTLAELSTLRNIRLRPPPGRTPPPASLPAFIAYLSGVDAFTRGAVNTAIGHYEEALDREPGYHPGRIGLAFAYMNAGRRAAADSMFDALDAVRTELTSYERAVVDLGQAIRSGDREARYNAARAVARIAPNTKAHVQWGHEALLSNRPRKALAIFAEIDPLHIEVAGYHPLWQSRAEALHVLGEHEKELQVWEEAKTYLADQPARLLLLEGYARVALGQVEQVWRIVRERRALSDSAEPDPGMLMVDLAVELRAHERPAASAAMFDSAIAWYRGRDSWQGGDHQFAWTLAASTLGRSGGPADDRLDEAEKIFREIGEGEYVGLLAAVRGNEAEARRVLADLEDAGSEPLALAAAAQILGALGAPDEGALRLRASLDAGLHAGIALHHDPFLEPLHGSPAFRAMLQGDDRGGTLPKTSKTPVKES